MTRGIEIIDRMRKRYESLGVIGKDAKIGIVSSFGEGSTTKESSPTDRNLRQVMTTDDIDLDDEVIDPKGIDWSWLLKNGEVFADHRYESEYRIGWIRYIDELKNGRGFAAGIQIYQGLKSPYADDAWAMATSKGRTGASIGFAAELVTPPTKSDPDRWKAARTVVRKSRAFELSLTGLPCNVSCQTLAWKEDDRKRADVQELVTKGLMRQVGADALGLGKAPRMRIVLGR